MQRRTIALVIGLFFAASLAFGYFEQQSPFQYRTAAVVGQISGVALEVFVVSGVLPLIGWAFGRFRASSAPGALIAWGMLGVLLMILTEMGRRAG